VAGIFLELWVGGLEEDFDAIEGRDYCFSLCSHVFISILFVIVYMPILLQEHMTYRTPSYPSR
jgi:hypothetical protein